MSTEKRLFLFLVLTFMVLAGYSVLMETFGPRPPVAQQEKDGEKDAAPGKEPGKDAVPAKQEEANEKSVEESAEKKTKQAGETPQPETRLEAAPPAERPAVPHRIVTLGEYRPPAGASPLLVTLSSRGGSLVRVELVGRTEDGKFRYRDLDDTVGYLGHLSLAIEPSGGCRIQAVPPGTPAALAQSEQTGVAVGLREGDVLVEVEGKPVDAPAELDRLFDRLKLKPRDTAKLVVKRKVDDAEQRLTFTAKLDERPFQLVKPEPLFEGETEPHPSSLLMAVRGEAGDRSAFLDRLREVDWETVELPGPAGGVEFRYQIDAAAAPDFGLSGPVEVIKRYQLGTSAGEVATLGLPYHLDFEVEIHNQASEQQTVHYQLQGFNGLPTEGWWYLTKLHPRWFNSAGARDVAIETGDGYRLLGASALLSRMKKEERTPLTPLFSENEPIESRSLRYLGIDTQYFAAAMLPIAADAQGAAEFSRAEAFVLDEIDEVPKGWERTANSTFQIRSMPLELPEDGRIVQKFRLFTGPKAPEVLAVYGLDNLIYYGWPIFGIMARILASILHFFYAIVGNYGIAIVLLTVLVRSCMFPISRTAARNAAMMQELAPEMRKIAEKHKNNLEARSKAQQELFRAHNYNPLGGCWLMFLQLPVFIGLYRCLATDIELRQAPLIPGLEWCSNLAGPDKLFYWKTDFFSYFTDESGWLGPYFNLLPIFTIVLFLLHQKLFTPPATDEQTEMQMKMMKFMTVFMGILFYKVPAGLCLYFITSSLWGIAERKLLPKPTPKKKTDELPANSRAGGAAAAGAGGGGGFSLSSLLQPRGGDKDKDEPGYDRKKDLQRKLRKK